MQIHDTLPATDFGTAIGLMSSPYHTVHHTKYKDNYGQLFVFMDWIHGTLTDFSLKRKTA